VSTLGTPDEINTHPTTLPGRVRLTLPEELAGLMVDVHMWSSIVNFVMHGLHPGSYGECLLLHDYEGAMARAHTVIRMWKANHGDDVTENMIRLIQVLPEICHGDVKRVWDWQINGGLEGQPKLLSLFRLTL
jgi:hypothetical protein